MSSKCPVAAPKKEAKKEEAKPADDDAAGRKCYNCGGMIHAYNAYCLFSPN
jgi:hypothetical protein